jgi:hypothetical protein
MPANKDVTIFRHPQSRHPPGCPPPNRVQKENNFLFFAGRAERFAVCRSIRCHAGMDASLASPRDSRECTSAAASQTFRRVPRHRGWRKAHPWGGEGGGHGRWQGYRRPSHSPCNDARRIWSGTMRGWYPHTKRMNKHLRRCPENTISKTVYSPGGFVHHRIVLYA